MIRELLYSESFKTRHVMQAVNFIRERKLTFQNMIILAIRKGVKSIQNTLNEAQREIANLQNLDEVITISSSAYTQARKKLNYTAFIELSNSCVELFYSDDEYQKFKCYRLLAIDGSIINLPCTEDIKKEFSTTLVKNQDETFQKEIVQARASTLYDILNHIVTDATLDDKIVDERTQAKAHLSKVKQNDLVIFDRGYPSYELFANMIKHNSADFLMRIKRNSFKEVAHLFNKECKQDDLILSLKPSTNSLKQTLEQSGLPLKIDVRFVRVVLDNGDIEVLATSVLNKERLKTEEFKYLYHLRWEIETYYGLLKNRLTLENFTGLSALSVKQDFYATIFISNYESVVTHDTNESLKEKETIYEQKVNRSTSFNTIKNYCFELFYSQKDIGILLSKMEKLFLGNVTIIRENRTFPRYNYEKTKHLRNSLNYHKRRKKVVY